MMCIIHVQQQEAGKANDIDMGMIHRWRLCREGGVFFWFLKTSALCLLSLQNWSKCWSDSNERGGWIRWAAEVFQGYLFQSLADGKDLPGCHCFLRHLCNIYDIVTPYSSTLHTWHSSSLLAARPALYHIACTLCLVCGIDLTVLAC